MKSLPNLPRSEDENLVYRDDLLSLCTEDPEHAKNVYKICKGDIIYWINSFCWSKDPKKPHKIIPFILYEDFQDKLIKDLCFAIEGGEDIGVEKTREMGVSWLVLYVFVWFWLFWPNSDFLVGSRKEDVVDQKGDPSTLFEKIRIMLRAMPGWMLPEGFDMEDHTMTMRVINPENGNSIIGESANAHFGSGGRVKACLLDEFSKWDPSISQSAWTSLADVTKCRIPVSTPLGSGNKFAVLMQGTETKIKKCIIHWTLHPDKAKGCYRLEPDGTHIPIDDHHEAFRQWLKNREVTRKGLKGGIIRSPWYDTECDRRTPSEISQELDISYLRSGAPFFDMLALNGQKSWKLLPTDPSRKNIPYGNYVQGIVIEERGKYKFLETEHDGWLNIFEMPLPYMTYVLGGDISEGLPKGDRSFGIVASRYDRHVSATIRGLYPPEMFAKYLFLAGKMFNDAIVAPENNVGYSVCRDLSIMGSNLYYTKKEETPDGTVVTLKRGFTTSSANRRMICDEGEGLIRKEHAQLRDPELIGESKTFVHNPKTGKPEADGMFKDDGVLAWVITMQVIQENPFIPKKENDSMNRAEAERRRNKKNAGFSFKKKG